MYHIKNDKRIKTSADLIYNGLVKLLTEKSFEEITITELAKISRVGKSTFYRIFDTKEDILYYKFDIIFDTLVVNTDKYNLSKEELFKLSTLKIIFNFFLTHKDFLETLHVCGLFEILKIRMRQRFNEKPYKLNNTLQFDDKTWDYFINIRSAILSECLYLVITKYHDDTSSDILDKVKTILGEAL